MNYKNLIGSCLFATALAACLSSCSDSKTYAELLTDETHYVNAFLADHRVVNTIPADTVFEYGENAPYYRLDEEGNIYMQVIEPGTKGNMATYNDLLYFRVTRYALNTYDGRKDGKDVFNSGEGNDAVLGGNYSFRFGNFELDSSYSRGPGIQAPLKYVPIDATVKVIVKSQYGMPTEISAVIPYLYCIRYFTPKI